MNNRGYSRRRKRRVTGRFYAFLTVVVVLCVMVGVLVANRAPSTASSPPPQPVQPILNTATQPPAEQETPAPSDPAQGGDPTQGDDPAQGGSSPVDSGADPAEDQAGPGSGIASVDDLLELDPDMAPATGTDQMDTSDLSVTPGLSPDWRNILLLGNDSRKIDKVSRTDTIMIASINTKDGRIKLTSIMRDMVVSITNQKGVTKDIKMNSVVGYGGPKAVMKKVNELFGMNITEYVMVNFKSFQKVIDILNGIRIDVTQAERDEINKGLGEAAMAAGYTQEEYLAKKDEWTLKAYGGDMPLNGIQALGYARIRHVGNGDTQRTERQRYVLEAVLKKVKEDAGPVQLLQIATQMWGEIQTNIDMMSAVSIATTVIRNGARMDTRGRIPGSSTGYKGEKRNGTWAIWDTDFEANKNLLYKYIYEEQ